MSKILTEEECQKIHESYSEMTHNPHIALRNILQLLYTISELRKENAELIAKKIDWEMIQTEFFSQFVIRHPNGIEFSQDVFNWFKQQIEEK